MDDGESEASVQLHKKAYQIFSDFMTRISKFEELVSLGNSLLISFRHQLELLQRSPRDKTSKMVDAIIKANETERMKAYIKDGCVTIHDGVQIISKLNTCQEGFQNHLSKARDLFDEIECLMDDMIGTMETANESKSHVWDKHSHDELVHQTKIVEKEEVESVRPKKHEVSDYAAMMGIVYSMLKQDYTMQEKIVSSLKLSSSLGELESYCLMWSLRPYINDIVMHEAWIYIR